MNKIIDNIKSGNYEVVDNQGVSVTGHFTQCLEKEFADLEAKLAESEEKCKKAYQEGLLQKQFDKDMEIEQLKQQLVEKEKELKQIKLDLGMFKSVNEFINEYGIKKAREVLLQTEKTKRQDKISFTIDILEELAGCSNYINSKLDFECGSYVSEKAIRDKIKYLKGKKDE